MKKSAIVLALFLIFATPCFGADQIESRRENYVALRDYLDRLIVEQNRYINTRFDAISSMFVEKQRALEVGATVLDAKFVRIDDFIKSTNLLNNSLANLSSRMIILETKASVQEQQSAALVAKWGLGLGAFFTIMQVLIALFINRRKER